jgi:hypothetical protein
MPALSSSSARRDLMATAGGRAPSGAGERLPRAPGASSASLTGASSAAASSGPHERERGETGGRRRGETGAKPFRPSKFNRQSRPTSGEHIPPGAAPLPSLPIQTAAGADRLRSAPSALQPNTRLQNTEESANRKCAIPCTNTAAIRCRQKQSNHRIL